MESPGAVPGARCRAWTKPLGQPRPPAQTRGAAERWCVVVPVLGTIPLVDQSSSILGLFQLSVGCIGSSRKQPAPHGAAALLHVVAQQ